MVDNKNEEIVQQYPGTRQYPGAKPRYNDLTYVSEQDVGNFIEAQRFKTPAGVFARTVFSFLSLSNVKGGSIPAIDGSEELSLISFQSSMLLSKWSPKPNLRASSLQK